MCIVKKHFLLSNKYKQKVKKIRTFFISGCTRVLCKKKNIEKCSVEMVAQSFRNFVHLPLKASQRTQKAQKSNGRSKLQCSLMQSMNDVERDREES